MCGRTSQPVVNIWYVVYLLVYVLRFLQPSSAKTIPGSGGPKFVLLSALVQAIRTRCRLKTEGRFLLYAIYYSKAADLREIVHFVLKARH